MQVTVSDTRSSKGTAECRLMVMSTFTGHHPEHVVMTTPETIIQHGTAIEEFGRPHRQPSRLFGNKIRWAAKVISELLAERRTR